MEAAGQRTGINPDHLRYYDAIKELEYDGAIESPTNARYARGDKYYVITKRGLDMLRESG
jgi:DNA-binding PadR family transcriptional regulator